MILPFSTVINSKPTYFVEKIIKSFDGVEMTPEDERMIDNAINSGYFNLDIYTDNLNTKKHTIREDNNHRWKPGTMIDFFINTRKKDMFRFAPRVPVMSLQYIEFKEIDTENYIILVDGKVLTINKIKELAQNDGFDNVKDFLNYFPTDFKGKIIHWTTLKY